MDICGVAGVEGGVDAGENECGSGNFVAATISSSERRSEEVKPGPRGRRDSGETIVDEAEIPRRRRAAGLWPTRSLDTSCTT